MNRRNHTLSYKRYRLIKKLLKEQAVTVGDVLSLMLYRDLIVRFLRPIRVRRDTFALGPSKYGLDRAVRV